MWTVLQTIFINENCDLFVHKDDVSQLILLCFYVMEGNTECNYVIDIAYTYSLSCLTHVT